MNAAEIKAEINRIAAKLDELTVLRARDARRLAPAPRLPPSSFFILGCVDMALCVTVQTDDPEAYELGRELYWLLERARRATL